jgi:hypothetical protein
MTESQYNPNPQSQGTEQLAPINALNPATGFKKGPVAQGIEQQTSNLRVGRSNRPGPVPSQSRIRALERDSDRQGGNESGNAAVCAP